MNPRPMGAMLAAALAATLNNPAALAGQAQRARDLARPQAARDVVEQCQALLAEAN